MKTSQSKYFLEDNNKKKKILNSFKSFKYLFNISTEYLAFKCKTCSLVNVPFICKNLEKIRKIGTKIKMGKIIKYCYFIKHNYFSSDL